MFIVTILRDSWKNSFLSLYSMLKTLGETWLWSYVYYNVEIKYWSTNNLTFLAICYRQLKRMLISGIIAAHVLKLLLGKGLSLQLLCLSLLGSGLLTLPPTAYQMLWLSKNHRGLDLILQWKLSQRMDLRDSSTGFIIVRSQQFETSL